MSIRSSRILQREHQVNRQLQTVVDHPWKKLFQEAARLLETRICIDLNKPRIEVLVKNKVITKELHAVLAVVGIYLALNRPHRVLDYLRNGPIYYPFKTALSPYQRLLDQILRLFKGKLISLFKGAIALIVSLHRIISEVHERLFEGLGRHVEFKGRSSHVALLKEEDLAFVVDEDPEPDVKLSSAEKKRPLKVLLNNKSVGFHPVWDSFEVGEI
jgi:hypothetical protein